MSSKLKQIPEALLARLWKGKASREKSLRAGDGRRFRVIYPGRTGTTAGPDFRDALLLEEGVGLVRGDVEIHVNQRDWAAHGHGNDPWYNGVVLHAVGGMNSPTTKLRSGNLVPVMSLDPLIHDSGVMGPEPGLWELLTVHGYGPPGNAIQAGTLLDDAGDKRFSGKSETFRRFLEEEHPEQVLYSAMMEALGYSQNREAFLELSNRVPYSRLEEAALGLRVPERTSAIQALLLSASGFVGSDARVAGMSLDRWRLFRVRPQNHPVQRISSFAGLMSRFLPSSVEDSSSLPREAGRGLIEGLTSLLLDTPVQGKRVKRWGPLEQGLVVVGRGRARDMAVNCVLPFLHALGQLNGDRHLESATLEVYREFPKLQENELTREMSEQLLNPLQRRDTAEEAESTRPNTDRSWARLVQNARRQQGLLHLQHLLASPGMASIKSAPDGVEGL